MSRAAVGGMAASRRRDRVDVRGEGVVVEHGAHQPDAQRLVGVDPVAEQEQLARLGRPDRPGQDPGAPVVARAPDAQERDHEHRRARRVAQVARARERQPGARARAVDRGDGDRRHAVQQLGDLHDRPQVDRLSAARRVRSSRSRRRRR